MGNDLDEAPWVDGAEGEVEVKGKDVGANDGEKEENGGEEGRNENKEVAGNDVEGGRRRVPRFGKYKAESKKLPKEEFMSWTESLGVSWITTEEATEGER